MKKMKTRKIIYWPLILTITFVMLGFLPLNFFVSNAEAIPPFARKYRTSCSTCHSIIFKRVAFGEAFRRNGYRLPVDDQLAVKEEPVKLGVEAWKKVWPEGIWPGAIPATVPIGFYVHMRGTWEESEKGEDRVDWTFDTPHEVEMLFGGTLGENVSFFGEWIAFEKGKTDEGRIGTFVIQYNDLFGLEDVLNVRFGRMDPAALSGFNAFKEDNRLTLSHYLPNDYRVVPSSDTVPGSGASINYKWRYRDKQAGIELNGIMFDRLEYIAGLVNGNNSVRDDNDYKDWYYRLSYKFFGETMTMNDAPEGELKIADNLVDNTVTIGTHGYFGKTALSAGALSWNNEFQRFGVDMRAQYQGAELGAAYIWGTDDDPGGPSGMAPIDNVDSASWMVEASYFIFPWLAPVIRYEEVDYDDSFSNDVERVTFNISALHTANLRWTAEYVYYPDDDDGRDTFKINLLTAF